MALTPLNLVRNLGGTVLRWHKKNLVSSHPMQVIGNREEEILSITTYLYLFSKINN